MLYPHVFITLEAPSDPFAAGLPMGPLFPIAEKARFQCHPQLKTVKTVIQLETVCYLFFWGKTYQGGMSYKKGSIYFWERLFLVFVLCDLVLGQCFLWQIVQTTCNAWRCTIKGLRGKMHFEAKCLCLSVSVSILRGLERDKCWAFSIV